MYNVDGKVYLAYSGEVSRDSSQARLLKRSWESIRRNAEFKQDCQSMSIERFTKKWGVRITNPKRSFDEIVREAERIKLDDSNTFNDMYRRLYGDSFYGTDRVVQCDEFNILHGTLSPNDFQRLSAIARGQIQYDAPLHTIERDAPAQSKIHLTINVDENPIAILYKVQFIMRALREARTQAGKIKPMPDRIKQQLRTLEETLDADLIGDGKRDFQHDDEVFRVWDLLEEGKSDSQIAKQLWPDEYRRVGGRDTATGEKGPLIQRVHRYKVKAKHWIQRFTEVVQGENVIL
jgi:hypothetical protein